MEDKKRGGLLKWVIIALLVWFAYDSLLAKHWTVNWSFKNAAVTHSFKDTSSPSFRTKKECIAYAADMNSLAEALKYDCGYKCEYDSIDTLISCKDY